MKQIKPVPKTTPEELRGLSDKIRGIADQIDNGEVLAISYAVHLTNDKYKPDWVKARGVSKLSMVGAAKMLAHEIMTDCMTND